MEEVFLHIAEFERQFAVDAARLSAGILRTSAPRMAYLFPLILLRASMFVFFIDLFVVLKCWKFGIWSTFSHQPSRLNVEWCDDGTETNAQGGGGGLEVIVCTNRL